jgi:hypothetical protein
VAAIGGAQVAPILPAFTVVGVLFYRSLPPARLPDGRPRPLLDQQEINEGWTRFIVRAIPTLALWLCAPALLDSGQEISGAVAAAIAAVAATWALVTVRGPST